ncbi:MAG TPA: PilZ domain-containing protein [Bryobacteraceae bacterium]|nr:PilZ domain-containing protein [Bryobacteraceae bacterium]
MQPDLELKRQPEGRASTRYPLNLSVQYYGLGGELDVNGSGKTVDISSCGISLATQSTGIPEIGSRIEIRVDWPALLGGVTPLRLVAEAVVIRSTERGFAIRYKNHKFITRKREPESASDEPSRMAAG